MPLHVRLTCKGDNASQKAAMLQGGRGEGNKHAESHTYQARSSCLLKGGMHHLRDVTTTTTRNVLKITKWRALYVVTYSSSDAQYLHVT